MAPKKEDHQNPVAWSVAKMAHHFDKMTEQVIDMNMCTDHCPCFRGFYNTTKDASPGYEKYSSISENYYNARNRTNIYGLPEEFEKQLKRRPMIWTNDLTKSYGSFEDCLKAHFDPSVENADKI